MRTKRPNKLIIIFYSYWYSLDNSLFLILGSQYWFLELKKKESSKTGTSFKLYIDGVGTIHSLIIHYRNTIHKLLEKFSKSKTFSGYLKYSQLK